MDRYTNNNTGELNALFASTFTVSDDHIDRRDESLVLLREQFQGLQKPVYPKAQPELGESDYIILDHKAKRKFIYKPKYISNRLAFCKYLSLPAVKKAFKSLSKYYSRFGEDVETNKSSDDIINAFTSCLRVGSILPELLNETVDFFEITYYDVNEYIPVGGTDITQQLNMKQLDEYYTSVTDLEMCIAPDISDLGFIGDPGNPHFYKNRDTGKLVLVDVLDLDFTAHLIPNLFEFDNDVFIVPDYKWSNPKYNTITKEGLRVIADSFSPTRVELMFM